MEPHKKNNSSSKTSKLKREVRAAKAAAKHLKKEVEKRKNQNKKHQSRRPVVKSRTKVVGTGVVASQVVPKTSEILRNWTNSELCGNGIVIGPTTQVGDVLFSTPLQVDAYPGSALDKEMVLWERWKMQTWGLKFTTTQSTMSSGQILVFWEPDPKATHGNSPDTVRLGALHTDKYFSNIWSNFSFTVKPAIRDSFERYCLASGSDARITTYGTFYVVYNGGATFTAPTKVYTVEHHQKITWLQRDLDPSGASGGSSQAKTTTGTPAQLLKGAVAAASGIEINIDQATGNFSVPRSTIGDTNNLLISLTSGISNNSGLSISSLLELAKTSGHLLDFATTSGLIPPNTSVSEAAQFLFDASQDVSGSFAAGLSSFGQATSPFAELIGVRVPGFVNSMRHPDFHRYVPAAFEKVQHETSLLNRSFPHVLKTRDNSGQLKATQYCQYMWEGNFQPTEFDTGTSFASIDPAATSQFQVAREYNEGVAPTSFQWKSQWVDQNTSTQGPLMRIKSPGPGMEILFACSILQSSEPVPNITPVMSGLAGNTRICHSANAGAPNSYVGMVYGKTSGTDDIVVQFVSAAADWNPQAFYTLGFVVVTGDTIPSSLVSAKFAELGQRVTFTGRDLFGTDPVNASLLPFDSGVRGTIPGPAGIFEYLDTTALDLTVQSTSDAEVCITPLLPGGWYVHVAATTRYVDTGSGSPKTWSALENWEGSMDYPDPLIEYDRGTNAYVVELCCYSGFTINGSTVSCSAGTDLVYEAFIALSDGVVDSLKLTMPKVGVSQGQALQFNWSAFEITLIPPAAASRYRRRLEDLGQKRGFVSIKAAHKVHERKDPAKGYIRL